MNALFQGDLRLRCRILDAEKPSHERVLHIGSRMAQMAYCREVWNLLGGMMTLRQSFMTVGLRPASGANACAIIDYGTTTMVNSVMVAGRGPG